MTWTNYPASERPGPSRAQFDFYPRLTALERRTLLTLLRLQYRDARAAGRTHRAASIAELGVRVRSAAPGQVVPQIELG